MPQQIKTKKHRTNKEALYYNWDWILSKNRLFSWAMGLRGGGKTYGLTKLAISKFLEKGQKTIWLRRYGSEIDDMFLKSFFSDMTEHEEFPNFDFTTKTYRISGLGEGLVREKGSEEWTPFITFVPLNTAMKHKSNPFPDVYYIMCDEWLIDPNISNLSYIKGWNEPIIFFEFIEGIIRTRKEPKVLFASNAISAVNPYFSYWGMKVDAENEWTMNKFVVVHNYKNPNLKEKKLETAWGQFLDNTSYGAYNMDNEYFVGSDEFVCKKPSGSRWYCNITLYGTPYGIWVSDNEGIIWIGDSNPTSEKLVCFATEDMKPNYIQISKNHELVKFLKNEWSIGKTWFDNQETKQKYLELIGLLSTAK